VSSLSCCLSAAAVCFLAVLFPPRISAFLTVSLSAAGLLRRTVSGFPCFALVRCDRCRASPIPRDRGALMADIETSATTAASQRRVLSFAVASHLPKFWITRLRSRKEISYFLGAIFKPMTRDDVDDCTLVISLRLLTEIHVSSPFPVFPLPATDGWSICPWAFSRASHPTVTSDACQEWGQALSTRSDLTVDIRPSPFGYLTHSVRPHVARRCPSGASPRRLHGCGPASRSYAGRHHPRATAKATLAAILREPPGVRRGMG
jgi:hypothetical protein